MGPLIIKAHTMNPDVANVRKEANAKSNSERRVLPKRVIPKWRMTHGMLAQAT